MEWIELGGKTERGNGVLRGEAGKQSFLFTKENAPADFSFEAEIRLVGAGDAGLYFRTVSKNGTGWLVGYSFLVNAETHTITLTKVSNGDHITKVLGTVRYPFSYGEWYKIAVYASGKNVRLYFNNFKYDEEPYPKFDLELGHFRQGTVGLAFGEGAAEFRNVRLEEYKAPEYDADNSYRNPILYGADPDIMFYDGTYYLYFTDTADMHIFQCYTSKDLIHWSEPYVVFHGEDGWGNNEYMSPNVVHKDGWFYMFYASHTAPDENGKRRAQVTYATSRSPLGPFRSAKKEPLHHDVQEICGMPFLDDDGRVYLSVVRFNHGNECWIMEIQLKDGVVTVLEDTVTKMFEATEPWEKDYANVVEGAVLCKHNGLYYAMYAGSHYKGSYAEGYAVARHPLGEWKKYEYNPILTSHYQARAVGDSVYTKSPDGKEWIMFYHQHYSPTEISPRWIRMDRMKFVKTDDGPDVMVVNGPTMT
ncbi:MAG: family 43 glycosylhydrolase, partial [Candidatus Gallimonas sp.]